ncbi:MAG TPA: hypothetical protein ENN29_02260 [Candidatus Hydrogenedentes bacterium]|nr:hypothetical protein [Candidatus Hydrogenedentota bacterium]
MNGRTVMMMVVMCLLFAACIMFLTDDAEAQTSSADKKTAVREGLGEKEIDEAKLPGKLEMGLAFGSIVAMIGVLKFV